VVEASASAGLVRDEVLVHFYHSAWEEYLGTAHCGFADTGLVCLHHIHLAWPLETDPPDGSKYPYQSSAEQEMVVIVEGKTVPTVLAAVVAAAVVVVVAPAFGPLPP